MATTNKILVGLESAEDYAKTQSIIHDWIRDDLSISAKMAIHPRDVAKLVDRLTGSRTTNVEVADGSRT